MQKICAGFALLGLPGCLFGAYSISLTPNNTSTITIPNSSPYNALTGYRFEGRLGNWSAPGSGYNFFLQDVAGSIAIDSAGTLHCLSNADSTTKQAQVLLPAYADFLFRCQRDAANSRMTLEVWNYDGQGYLSDVEPTAPNPQPVSWSNGLALGSSSADPNARLSLAYLRWYSTVLPVNSPPPSNSSLGGDLAEWEFERTGAATGRSNLTFSSWTGATPTYVATPVYAPSALISALPFTVRAGTTVPLDASASISFAVNPQLTFVWQQTQFVPLLNTGTADVLSPADALAFGSVQWSSQASSRPLVTLPLAGTYYFQLTVTDAAGKTDVQSFKIGAVASDANGVVIMPDPNMSFLVGPLTLWGSSPWPWYDKVMKADADALFGPGGVPPTPPFQPTASGSAGTLTVTNVQTGDAWLNVLGTGTSFTTDFACNGTDTIVIYYHLQNGKNGARPYTVVACPDDTHMTINQFSTAIIGYDASAPQSGVAYGKVNAAQLFGWQSATTSWNYYDVVLGLYRLYYRSGVDTYLNYARQLADNWYVYPLDGGRAFNNGEYPPQGARSAGILGMMARALDGHPERWLDSSAMGAPGPVGTSYSGIKGAVDELTYGYLTAFFSPPYDSGDFVDGRETGYAAWFLTAYAYLYDPSYYAQARNFFLGPNSFASRYHSGFGFTTNVNPFSASGGETGYGYSGPNYQGSYWLTAFLFKALVAFVETSPVSADRNQAMSLLQNSFDDYISSHYMSGSCQEITYSSNYLSCDSGNMPYNPVNGLPSGTVTAINGSTNVTGSGTQFNNASIFKNDGTDYIGINVGTGFQLLHIPAGGIASAASLVATSPFGPQSGSNLSFGRAAACPSGIGTPVLPQNTFSTLDANIGACDSPPHYGMGGRAVAELVHQVNGFLYYKTGLPGYKIRGDALFAAAYGCGTPVLGCLSGGRATGIGGGGPGSDSGAGNFADLLTFTIDSQNARGKEFGSNAGAGLADTYLAYRLGGPAAETHRPVRIVFDLSSAPGASEASVSVAQPSGQVTLTVCSSSPCEVTVDARQGNHSIKLDYQSSSGAVVARGKAALLTIQ